MTLIVRSPGARHYPPRWLTWTDLVDQGAVPADIGFSCFQADLNRFAARYRLAHSLKNVELDDYRLETSAGYTALFRMFLTWSAVEQYLKALPCSQHDCLYELDADFPRNVCARVRLIDKDDRFFGLIYSLTRGETKRVIGSYLAGKEINFTFLASAIRHIFAHGFLTPNASRANPFAVKRICNGLSNVVLRGVGTDFERRVDAL